MKISMVLITYNHSKYIESALKNFFDQSYANVEYLISDDASHDGTYEIIENFIHNLDSEKLNKIKYLRKNSGNLGICPNLQTVMKYCSGEYIALFAGDDISDINRIQRAANIIEKEKNIYAYTTNLNYIDTDGNPIEGPPRNSTFYIYSMNQYLKRYYSKKECIFNGCAAIYSSRVVKTSIINRGINAEDVSLLHSALCFGSVIFDDYHSVNYRIGLSQQQSVLNGFINRYSIMQNLLAIAKENQYAFNISECIQLNIISIKIYLSRFKKWLLK